MLGKFKNKVDIYLELGKVRITFFVAFSTLIGSILFAGNMYLQMILPTLGVFLLACGSSTINHYQERRTDALMDRTKSRPIPAGRISPGGALIVAAIYILSGSFLLFYFAGVVSLLLGWTALLWYNLFYTPMKKKYVLAVVPGSLIGAIPPVIGWTAVGGYALDPKILSLALFFFIWQIPHFWLLLLLYSKDYEKAGFPTLTKIFSNLQLSRITFVWIAALATSCLLIPLFNISTTLITPVLLILMGVWLLFNSKNILSDLSKIIFRKAFVYVNVYVLFVVVLLSIDKLLLTEL